MEKSRQINLYGLDLRQVMCILISEKLKIDFAKIEDGKHSFSEKIEDMCHQDNRLCYKKPVNKVLRKFTEFNSYLFWQNGLDVEGYGWFSDKFKVSGCASNIIIVPTDDNFNVEIMVYVQREDEDILLVTLHNEYKSREEFANFIEPFGDDIPFLKLDKYVILNTDPVVTGESFKEIYERMLEIQAYNKKPSPSLPQLLEAKIEELKAEYYLSENIIAETLNRTFEDIDMSDLNLNRDIVHKTQEAVASLENFSEQNQFFNIYDRISKLQFIEELILQLGYIKKNMEDYYNN